MPVIPNNVDWSATAAWIALVVSIIGTIAGPIISSLINNSHQLKIRKLEIQEKTLESYENKRHEIITSFLSSVGLFLSHPNTYNIESFGRSFYSVYQYIPESSWNNFDEFYLLCISKNYDLAREKFPTISHELNAILKETHQLSALK